MNDEAHAESASAIDVREQITHEQLRDEITNDVAAKIVSAIETLRDQLVSPVRRDTCDAVITIINERLF